MAFLIKKHFKYNMLKRICLYALNDTKEVELDQRQFWLRIWNLHWIFHRIGYLTLKYYKMGGSKNTARLSIRRAASLLRLPINSIKIKINFKLKGRVSWDILYLCAHAMYLHYIYSSVRVVTVWHFISSYEIDNCNFTSA